MAKPTNVKKPAVASTKTPNVSAKEPVRPDPTAKEDEATEDKEVQTSTEAQEKGASGGDDTTVKDADNAGGGDGVTGKTNDGATDKSNDGATGTPNAKSAQISTKEGDAPQGVERDQGFSDVLPSGPTSTQQAALAASMPAGVLVAKGPVDDVGAKVMEIIRDFADLPADKKVFATSNIHDDLRIQRAEVLLFASKVEEAFGIDITPSEAQNFLLVRDVVNLTLRKLARK